MFLFRRIPLALFIPLFVATGAAAEHAAKAGPIETVLVEGQQLRLNLEQERALTPGAVTVLDMDELAERNVSNLADMLRYVPGMWVAGGSTGDSSFFSSRGSNLDATNYDGNGIKLLQDGLPVTAADGNNHNRSVDPLATRYAVVARGANALTYGASTLGGAINFVSPTARDTESQILLNGGSHGQLQGRLTAGAVAGAFDGLLTLETRRWDGYRKAMHEQQRESLYTNAGWQPSDATRSRFYFSYIDNEQDLPGALSAAQFAEDPYQASPANVLGNFQYNVETWRVANLNEWDISDASAFSVGFSYEAQALYHPIVYSPFFSLLIDTDQNNVGTSLRYNWHLGDHDMLFGLNYGETTVEGGNYSHEAGRRKDLITLVDNKADGLELFWVDRWQFTEQWQVIYGVQTLAANREVHNTNVASGVLYNPKGDYDSINPRVGVIYHLNASSDMFANLSRLYEAPTNYELEDDASTDDRPLKAMRGSVVEVGTRGDSAWGDTHHWRWELAFYYARLQNEILSEEPEDAPGTSLSINVDDTIHAGIEALLGASFAVDDNSTHRLEPLLTVTLNAFSFDGDSRYGDNALPVAPDYLVRGEVMYRHASGLFIGPTFDVVDERYADFANHYTVDGYSLFGLRAGYRGDHWEFYADARNLADKAYVSVFSVRNRIAPEEANSTAILQAGEPRSLYVGAIYRF